MTHEDAGKYATKHPPGTTLNERIGEAVREKSPDGRLACASAEIISKELAVPMSEVGITLDLLEIKIKRCQLGLFGYEGKPDHGKDIQKPESVPDEMKSAIEKGAANGNIACAAVWKIADHLATRRNTISGACETLGIKIQPCQLGAF